MKINDIKIEFGEIDPNERANDPFLPWNSYFKVILGRILPLNINSPFLQQGHKSISNPVILKINSAYDGELMYSIKRMDWC